MGTQPPPMGGSFRCVTVLIPRHLLRHAPRLPSQMLARALRCSCPPRALFPALSRVLHSSPPLCAKGGREPSGKARPTPSSKAAARAAAPAAPPSAPEGDEGGDDFAEDAAASKDKSVAGLLARQVAFARRELERVRGSTPSAGMLDGVSVPAYGESKPLQELAQVVLRPPATLLVSPFDASLAGAIAEAIRAADLGLNPQDEGGGALRVPIPKASKETREAAVKLVSKIAEQAKVRVRRVRAGALGDLKKQAGLPEDDLKREVEAVERAAAAATAEVAKLAETKRVLLEKM